MVIIYAPGTYDTFLKTHILAFLTAKVVLLIRINNVPMFSASIIPQRCSRLFSKPKQNFSTKHFPVH